MDLPMLVNNLAARPHITKHFSLPDFLLFTRVLQVLKERLSWLSDPTHYAPPHALPPDVKTFLCSAFHLDTLTDIDVLDDCWAIVRDSLWASVDGVDAGIFLSRELLDVFMLHGIENGIGVWYHFISLGFCDLFPPVRTCINAECEGATTLTGLEPIQSVYYTREFGPIPAFAYSAKCRACYARYYHNYYVHARGVNRTYYGGVPSVIQITKHAYIEASLCEQLTTSMVCGWLSAANNARIYNSQHADGDGRFPLHWTISNHHLDGPMVADAFFLYALLRDHYEHTAAPFVLRNDTDHDTRIELALRARNQSMVGPGQEEWSHICNRCCEIKTGADAQTYIMRAVVTDGITIGRPCCSVHDCKGRLPTQRSRYCEQHASLVNQCSVEGCERAVDHGFKTCNEPSHRKIEARGEETRSALFQLQRRLERHRVAHLNDSMAAINNSVTGFNADTVEVTEVDEDGECNDKSEEGNRKLRARLGRRWTHNEQLCVATCGVILGRATFYGSEAVNGVRLFLRRLFPTLRSLPHIIFYDNACNFKRMLMSMNPPDHYFDACVLPVDVFHMRSKHSQADAFCNLNCNPAQFPDLYNNGQWRFNSSAAEITNAWFGGFKSIVREMREDRYDFFLDEMVKQKNRMMVGELERRGENPHHLNTAWLLSSEPTL
ncbi:hypothetical protein K474DRAFT_1684282 [Panus rudis PR-1116 ss-1]|nr:hypothetical protein K474DRAFT_1684282 [Panus rudis PR-1116 ss-1]